MSFRKFREVCCNLNATFYEQNTMMDVYYDDNACLQVKMQEYQKYSDVFFLSGIFVL